MRVLALFVSALVIFTAAAAGEPEGFVIEVMLATPGADTPVMRDTVIDVADGGYVVIVARSGQLVRRDGPYNGPAADLLDGFNAPGDDDLGNPYLESLLELAELSRTSENTAAAVRGKLIESELHASAITAAAHDFCIEPGTLPAFYVSRAPARDELLMFRRQVSPKGFLQTTWPVGATTLPWPEDWPPLEEARYIWTLGDRGPVTLRIRMIEMLPAGLVERIALFHDLRCDSQAIPLIREFLAVAERR